MLSLDISIHKSIGFKPSGSSNFFSLHFVWIALFFFRGSSTTFFSRCCLSGFEIEEVYVSNERIPGFEMENAICEFFFWGSRFFFLALLQCFLSGFIKQGTEVHKKDMTSLERFRFCSVSSMHTVIFKCILPGSAIPEEQSSRLGHLLQICSAVHLKCPACSFFTQGSQDHYSDIAYIPLCSPLEYLSIFIAVGFTWLLDILISASWPETSVRTSSVWCHCMFELIG